MFTKNKYNPNVISKLFITIVLGTTVMHPMNELSTFLVVLIYFILYCLNNDFLHAIKVVTIYGILLYIVTYINLEKTNFFVSMIVTAIISFKLFFLPFLAGVFFAKTSDVTSVIEALDFLRIPRGFSIPIAVMFRFFPSFKEEKKHIIMAMKIKGVTPKRPLKYLEYICIPLLMISSIISDDISKTAETKCIANPIKKIRYRKISFSIIDIFFLCFITSLLLGVFPWSR